MIHFHDNGHLKFKIPVNNDEGKFLREFFVKMCEIIKFIELSALK